MKKSAVKYEQQLSNLTISEAFNMKSVTPDSKSKDEGVASATETTNDDSDDKLLTFNFDNYKKMEQYEVVINNSGDFVPICSPRMTYFQPPQDGGFTDHHIFFKCESLSQRFTDRTVVPMKGMFSYLFNEKTFIKKEHEVLNGKINVWRVEYMKAFTKIRKIGEVTQEDIATQESFVRDKVGTIQKCIASFDYCDISILNKKAITRLLMLEDQPEHSTEVVYAFSKYDVIHVYTKPGGLYKFDLVTCFNRDRKLDYVFGKADKDTIKDRVYGKRLKIG